MSRVDANKRADPKHAPKHNQSTVGMQSNSLTLTQLVYDAVT